MNEEQLFEHIEGLLCYVGEIIDKPIVSHPDFGVDSDLNEVWQWLEDIMIQYEKTFSIGKRGETR